MIRIFCCTALILSLVLHPAPVRGGEWACGVDTWYEGTGTVVQTITYKGVSASCAAPGATIQFVFLGGQNRYEGFVNQTLGCDPIWEWTDDGYILGGVNESVLPGGHSFQGEHNNGVLKSMSRSSLYPDNPTSPSFTLQSGGFYASESDDLLDVRFTAVSSYKDPEPPGHTLTYSYDFSTLKRTCGESLKPSDGCGPNSARLSDVVGDVEVKLASSDDWEPANNGMCLGEKDYVSTGYNSSVTLVFGKVNKLHVKEMTQLRIAQFFLSKDVATTQLELRIGSINAHVDKSVVSETSFKATTPTATLSVRGTEFRATVDQQGASELVVREGTVDMTSVQPDAESFAVMAGNYGRMTESEVELRSATSQEMAQLDEDFGVLNSMRSDFSVAPPAGWTDDGSGRWTVDNGVYAMNGNQGDNIRSAYLDTESCNFTYAADVKKVSGDGAGMVYSYGLLFRGDGTTNNNYEFNILKDGRYRIGRNQAGQFAWLNDWTLDAALHPGYDTWNRLKVVAQGKVLKFYANDTCLKTVEDDTFTCGRPGLFAIDAANSSPADMVQFDNAELIPYLACQPLSATRDLSIACAEYAGLRMGFTLKFLTRAADPDGLYWVLDPLSMTLPLPSAQCVQFERDFGMTIPCALYDQVKVGFRLQFTPEALAEGLIWKLDLDSYNGPPIFD